MRCCHCGGRQVSVNILNRKTKQKNKRKGKWNLNNVKVILLPVLHSKPDIITNPLLLLQKGFFLKYIVHNFPVVCMNPEPFLSNDSSDTHNCIIWPSTMPFNLNQTYDSYRNLIIITKQTSFKGYKPRN